MAVALVGIGTWVAGAVGVTGISAITAGVIGGAIVGAAIGGITAAITGGSIGKGLLFGAIGGAVLGGIGAWAAGGSGVSGTAFTQGVTNAGATGAVDSFGGVSVGTIGGETSGTVAGITGGLKGGLWQGAGAAAVTTAGSALQGAFTEDAADPNDPEERQKDRDLEKELTYAQLEAQKEIAAMQASSSGSSGGGGEAAAEASKYATDAELQNAREQREQDWKVNEREYTAIAQAKDERRESVLGLQVTGDNVKAPDPNAKSIDEQSYAQTKIPSQTTAAPQYSGVLNKPVEEQQVA